MLSQPRIHDLLRLLRDKQPYHNLEYFCHPNRRALSKRVRIRLGGWARSFAPPAWGWAPFYIRKNIREKIYIALAISIRMGRR